MRIEQTILSNLLHNEEYARKVLPFVNKRYFSERKEAIIFEEYQNFFDKYNKPITKEILVIEVSSRKDLTDKEYNEFSDYINKIEHAPTNTDWLYNETESFCKKKAVYNAILDSIGIIDGKDKQRSEDAIPSMLSDALGVSFDSHVGHSYIDDSDSRFEYYHRVEEKIRFDLDMLNKITKGGLSKKTLNVVLAGTGVGKSLFMCHAAAANLIDNQNVLYITMEMAEERIAERIDANLLNVSMEDLHMLNKKMFNDKIVNLQGKTTGTVIIKEYPTASAGANHFRALVNELALKKSFKPDIVFVDYINICASSRFKAGANVNSYTYIKGIAEELRGLAVEFDLPIVSATQTTRTGFVSTDIGLEDTSESFGLPATADFMFALIQTEELEELNQILIKQLKNRYADPTANKKFIIGVDRAKMKLYDVNQTAQEDMVDNGQGEELIDRFADFKV